MSERRDYGITLTIIAPNLTEDEANAMIDGLHGYVHEHIAPITGQWMLGSEQSLVETDWQGGWQIITRKAWICERCDRVQPKGSVAIQQRIGRNKRRICEACSE